MECNNHASRFDSAYKEVVELTQRPDEIDPGLMLPGLKPSPRPGSVRRGAFARSILFGAFALNPLLRELQPEMAESLLKDEPVDLELAERRLLLANAIGERSRVHGCIAGFPFLGRQQNGVPLGLFADAGAHLRPIAWMLTSKEPGLADVEGWADVSSWARLDPDRTFDSKSSLGGLPAVRLPDSRYWIELNASEGSIQVEAFARFPGSRSYSFEDRTIEAG